MRPGETRRLAVASSTAGIRELAAFCADALEGLFDAKNAAMVEIAVVEAANNAARHGYELEGGHPIELEIRHDGTDLELVLRDEGAEFNLADVNEPDFEWDNVKDVPEGGWGVFLIKSIMDEIKYARRDGVNFLEMRKRLPRESSETHSRAIPDFRVFRDAQIEDDEGLRENEDTLEEMAEELSAAYESLNLFYSLSRDVALVSDLDAFLENTLDKMLAVVPEASWGMARLKEEDKLRLHAATSKCPPETLVENIPFDDDSIEGKATATSKRVFGESYGEVPGRVMCLPIVGLDEFLGTILVGKEPGSDLFTAGDAKLARALADQIAVSIENSRLYSKAIAAEIAERELGIATELQRKLILKTPPVAKGLKCHMISATAKQVGGDYATLRKMDDGTVYLAVCDAMGKGMSASYFSLMSHMAVHSVILQQHDSGVTPGGILTLINKIMASDFDLFGMFMTALVAKFVPGKNNLVYASAGHCPPIIHFPDGDGTAVLDTVDFMLGVEPDTTYADLSTPFPKGTRLLLYTDGLTDVAEHCSEETLGMAPLVAACEKELAENDIETACQNIFDAILEKTGGRVEDDVSIIGVERTDD